MKLGKLLVESSIPSELEGLYKIANNFWFTFNNRATELFKEIDKNLFEKTNNNPLTFLRKVSIEKLNNVLKDDSFMKKYNSVLDNFDNYLNTNDTWFNNSYPNHKNTKIAYFSAEYGINEILPVYSGGLGVLSADHLKSASDMGVPIVGIGLFYNKGYFNQQIDHNGWQHSSYPNINSNDLPISTVKDENGHVLLLNLPLADRTIYFKAWKLKIGRINLYLLDTNVEKNNFSDREITSSLYGGNNETRISQEIVMGIGGVKLLKKLNINPDVYHMNEGHQSFVALELINTYMKDKNLSFNSAKEAVGSKCVFTTHTPVPAGFDRFSHELIDKYLENYLTSLKLTKSEFMNLGSNFGNNDKFNMAALGLNTAYFRNGVSKLHGEVTRKLFSWLYTEIPTEEIPIGHITNGIHTLSWLHPKMESLFDEYLDENWKLNIYKNETWDRIADIPDSKLWAMHEEIKKESVCFLRKRILSREESIFSLDEVQTMLDPKALTIGFARRFATYKRAALIFRNIERIKSILNMKNMPVQIVFAGKAHPQDHPGKELIQEIINISRREGFKGKVLFVEDYNIEVARYLVQGVDVWLNTPRKPLEASGTSGQKASLNGVLNFAIMDGWWVEGYNGKNGFKIGTDQNYNSYEAQDNVDSKSIYSQLENDIIPLFYDKNEEGIPVNWVKYMKESIMSTAGKFSSDRMIKNYTEDYYLPAMEYSKTLEKDNFAKAKSLSDYISKLKSTWNEINIFSFNDSNQLNQISLDSDSPTEIYIDLYLGQITKDDVKVQMCIEKDVDTFVNPKTYEMNYAEDILNGCHRYHIKIENIDTGQYIYSFRIIPEHELLRNNFDIKLIRWA